MDYKEKTCKELITLCKQLDIKGYTKKNKISFPCILTREIIGNLINKGTTDNIPYGMYN